MLKNEINVELLERYCKLNNINFSLSIETCLLEETITG